MTLFLGALALGAAGAAWAGVALRSLKSSGHALLIIGGLWIIEAVAWLFLPTPGTFLGIEGFQVGYVLPAIAVFVIAGGACALMEGWRQERPKE